ncbi:acyl-CoA dehydrogenase family protein [Actinokineospora bangkokensis]|uniref:Acyl-CoA dehydrogenase n=1 Tax=Actinokineospora bangkokensis TaxID=1193682 RepID=A0A1Q9LKD5_9PSEU|nr:acyl-CoA dehydrogenase family protein [Actinokineospora bangkokensis]OLR92511.1 acyl-CoA dehydrogenase [Actinokineospora bangkokensis]
MSEHLAAAAAVADRLRADAAERDRAARPPVREVGLLRDAGLLGVRPDDHATTHAVVRVVAAADASIGHLLAYHYLHLWRVGLFDHGGAARRIWRDTAARGWFWGGASNPGDVLTVRPEGGRLLLSGTRAFATGCAVGDRLVVNATRTDTGAKLTLDVDARAPGVHHPHDWDNTGQRLTASGSVRFTDVVVDEDQVVGILPTDPDDPRTPRLMLSSIGYQSGLAQVLVGLTEGALAAAAEYTRTTTKPFALSGVDRAVDDPYVLAGYGGAVAQTRGAQLAVEAGIAALQAASDAGPALTPRQRGETGVVVSVGKVLACDTANRVTAEVLEFTGARATATEHGFDRFWRNARTLTLHDPVAYKAKEIGAHYLTGQLPTTTAFS